jgi:hypothetical protein
MGLHGLLRGYIYLLIQAYRKHFHVIQENGERLELDGTHQLLVYADVSFYWKRT